MPEGKMTEYQIEIDDYKTELIREIQHIREHAKEQMPEFLIPQTSLKCIISAGELIPELPEPALCHHVDTVIEAARCIAIWQGVGSRAEKIDPLAGLWLPLMHDVNMWLACGARFI
ncbi:unnamed protein product [Heligmosomoides polygyrus]|uniref:Prophage protein n=1 Tax=Heligmosomoides polygyrus TaxID=6339 RepID=A0A183F4L1_HELPZ|nr:unnamed protein product [Heligmosomoides polygyrus]